MIKVRIRNIRNPIMFQEAIAQYEKKGYTIEKCDDGHVYCKKDDDEICIRLKNMNIKCSVCGASLKPCDKICHNCGTKVR